ncbi:MAG: hypothetical protein ACREAC_14500, partial [Blastocatellia bacterium]
MIHKKRVLIVVLTALFFAHAYFSYGSRRVGHEEGRKMFKGLRLAVYYSSDINKAKAWYAGILG